MDNLGKDHHYAAFISYAHADEAMAKKLHVALETYPLPKGMDKAERAKLFPIFRDVTELTAHHSLSEKIRDAVRTSRFLIVLCSPAAMASHWVNEEIKLFRKLHGEGSILGVIVDGVPDTAFPPALTEDGREPLAANMATSEGFRFGVTQLAASMLGVGLDTLVQRDQKRRRLRTQLVTGVSTALALIMGALAWTAVDARDEAQVAQGKAETSRNAAEEMVEFMIKDLKNDLVPIQKLDLFESVGKRVAQYYDAIPLEDMDDDRLLRQARARHITGDVAINVGDFERAASELMAAHSASEKVLQRNPDNTNAIFSHSQSEYWMGALYFKQDEFEKALPHWQAYDDYSQRLAKADPKNIDMLMEAGWGKNNVALLYLRMENFEKASIYYSESIELFETVLKIKPLDYVKAEIANAFDGASQSEARLKNFDNALEYKVKAHDYYTQLFQKSPNNRNWQFRLIQSKFRLLKYKLSDRCTNIQFQEIRRDLKNLLEFDKENQEWAEEYFVQSQTALVNCLTRNQDRTDVLKEFKIAKKLTKPNEYTNKLLRELETHPNYPKLVQQLQ